MEVHPEQVDLYDIIHNIPDHEIKKDIAVAKSIEQLEAESCYRALRCSKGTVSLLLQPHEHITEHIIEELDKYIDIFTNPVKVARVGELGSDDACRIMITWLSELVVYFGRGVLIEAEVIMLPLYVFTSQMPLYRYKYFENTLNKVRKWFKILRKKLKPYLSP